MRKLCTSMTCMHNCTYNIYMIVLIQYTYIVLMHTYIILMLYFQVTHKIMANEENGKYKFKKVKQEI